MVTIKRESRSAVDLVQPIFELCLNLQGLIISKLFDTLQGEVLENTVEGVTRK